MQEKDLLPYPHISTTSNDQIMDSGTSSEGKNRHERPKSNTEISSFVLCVILHAEPMKENMSVDLSEFWLFPLSPKFYPRDQQDWEDKIIQDNSSEVGDNSAKSCEISGPDFEVVVDKKTELVTKAQNQRSKFQVAVDDKDGKNLGLHARTMLITRP